MIYVMRHGQSTVNVEKRLTCKELDGDLTPLGQEQTQKAARWLADKAITAIYYSPFHRAAQTAEIIGETLDVSPVVDVDLREMDCGELEGRTDIDAWEIWARVYNRWTAREWDAAFPGGETLRNAHNRFLRALMRARKSQHTLLVTHGGIARSVVPHLCVNAAALQGIVDLDNTGFAVIEPYDPGRYVCRAWNLVEHLN